MIQALDSKRDILIGLAGKILATAILSAIIVHALASCGVDLSSVFDNLAHGLEDLFDRLF